jgi:translation initiation factor eIF-2B subunit alpha/methylthioribose-1-phosphate isomerase
MKVRIDGKEKEIYTLWREGSNVKLIDQRLLPHQFKILTLKNHRDTANAIKSMILRGAGAIGVAGGYGMAQAAFEAKSLSLEKFNQFIEESAERLKRTRPTAANLFHAIDRCLKAGRFGTVTDRMEAIVNMADKIAKEDLWASQLIGEYGNTLIENGFRILTHCNAGALAFLDYGTALSPIRYAHASGKKIFVWVDETRPRCQGARLTAWEMEQEGIQYAIIVDNAAGHFMYRGKVDILITGADRIAANGDVANKIGTYEKAVVAKENGIPFYVAAPWMTFDLKSHRGEEIEIEERGTEEVSGMWGIDEDGNACRVEVAGEGFNVRNPAFDVTPARYVTGFITEKGIIYPPFEDNIRLTFGQDMAF